MSKTFPSVFLARHGETAWTVTGQHTGRTDLPLTERGECNALLLRERLSGLTIAKVFASPLKRAVQTCELAGFGSIARIEHDLVEWDYGEYEGRLTADILAERPGWELFRDGCPGGESPQQVATRADRVVERLRAVADDVLFFPVVIFSACWLLAGPVSKSSTPEPSCWAQPASAYWVMNTASHSLPFGCGTTHTMCSRQARRTVFASPSNQQSPR